MVIEDGILLNNLTLISRIVIQVLRILLFEACIGLIIISGINACAGIALFILSLGSFHSRVSILVSVFFDYITCREDKMFSLSTRDTPHNKA